MRQGTKKERYGYLFAICGKNWSKLVALKMLWKINIRSSLRTSCVRLSFERTWGRCMTEKHQDEVFRSLTMYIFVQIESRLSILSSNVCSNFNTWSSKPHHALLWEILAWRLYVGFSNSWRDITCCKESLCWKKWCLGLDSFQHSLLT